MRGRRLVLLDAPSNLGLRPPAPGREPGCRRLAEVFRAHGIRERLAAAEGGWVSPPAYSPEVDARTGVRNGGTIPDYSRRLADRIGELVEGGDFPVVLGGDCSILLGAALGLRRIGRFGLAFVDGHLDFRHPANAGAVGAVAGEDLAVVTGRGSPLLTDIEGLRPYVRDTDVVAFGFREGPDQGDAIDILDTPIALFSLDRIRELGPAAALDAALERLEHGDTRGFWIHVDADVLDPAIMPAVDSPDPGGMTFEELRSTLGRLLASPRAIGLEITVFDPDLDPDGVLAERLVTLLADAFGDAAESGPGGTIGE